MALAIHLNDLVATGKVGTFRELAAAGCVSRARLSQILQFTHLAPAIQEELLFLPPTLRGPDSLKTQAVRDFLEAYPKVRFHFTPTYSSWLNQVEVWFSKIEWSVIARGVFTSVADLRRKFMKYIGTSGHTQNPRGLFAGPIPIPSIVSALNQSPGRPTRCNTILHEA